MAHSSSSSPSESPTVRIRGRGNQVVFELPEEEPWEDVLALLRAHLEQARGFFAGEPVAVDLGQRPLDVDGLQQLRDLLAEQKMDLSALMADNDQTQEAAQTLSILLAEATPEETPNYLRPPWEVLVSAERPERTTDPATGDDAPGDGEEEPLAISVDVLPTVPPYIFRGIVRSGQILRHAGSIVLLGDVNPGGQVIAGGDVLVWGRLWGTVHAGALGDARAVVAALDFEPVQLRISQYVARTAKEESEAPARWFRRTRIAGPELARVVDEEIVVEKWDAPGARFRRE